MEEPFDNDTINNINKKLGNVNEINIDNNQNVFGLNNIENVVNNNEVNEILENLSVVNTNVGEVNEGVNTQNTTNLKTVTNVPAKVSTWSKIKAFLFQEINFGFKPKTEAKLQEAHDFWHQDVTTEKVHNFLFQKIKFWK